MEESNDETLELLQRRLQTAECDTKHLLKALNQMGLPAKKYKHGSNVRMQFHLPNIYRQ